MAFRVEEADHAQCGRGWAAQRPPIQLQRRSIVAAPGRASPRLGAVSCNRLLCQPGTTTVREPVRGACMAAPVGPSDGWKRRES